MNCEIRNPLTMAFKRALRPVLSNNFRAPDLVKLAACGDENGVKAVLDAAQDPKAAVNAVNFFDDTALMQASGNGHDNVVKTLLERGAYRDRQNVEGYTALIIASAQGHAGIVGGLLEAGANAGIRNERGISALMAASLNGHAQVIGVFLDRKACDGEDMGVSLILALEMGNRAAAWRLAGAPGIDVNFRNRHGETPLILAVQGGHEDIVGMLLEKGADVNAYARRPDEIEGSAGLRGTALEQAEQLGHANIAGMLRQHASRQPAPGPTLLM